jgi:DNA helicase II / ATP-dependent DNA helicase PcrA
MSYTDEQLAAIEHPNGHSLTFAVAGSGKTHMLVGRALFLLEQGIPPERIRVLAFNKAAAIEFAGRLDRALPASAKRPKVSTFHSLGLSLTKLFEQRGLLPHRRLEDQDSVAKKLAREAVLAALQEEDSDDYPSQDDFEAFTAFIGLVKSDILSAARLFAEHGIPSDYRYFVRAFALFEEARTRAGLRFFADLQSEPVALMRARPEALALVTNKLDVVIVDEFQDVSRIQVEMLTQLIGTRASLNAVGDDSQCIYAWRGSRPELMGAEFDRHFPGATRFTLTRTFRFGHRLSLAAGMLIANNRNRVDTLCVSAPSTPDTGIDVIRTTTDGDQSAVVAAIEAWSRSGKSLHDCAVLSRLWAQTLGLELELLEKDIPYHKPKGDLFSLPDLVGLLGWLRLAAGSLFDEPRAPEIVRAMLSTPTLWLPAMTIADLAEQIAAHPARARDRLYALAKTIRKPYHANRIRDRADLWSEAAGWSTLPARDVLRLYAARTELAESFARSASTETATEKDLVYRTLLQRASRGHASIPEFLSRMDRLGLSRQRYGTGSDVVLLCTIHQAKGLEWGLVICAGLEEGQFPSNRSDLEEERRLAYVAFTRAKEELRIVVPPDKRFDAAWDGRPLRGSAVSRTPASRFAFEAELRTARSIGGAITDRLSGSDAAGPMPGAPACAAPLLNRYLTEVGIPHRYPPPKSRKRGVGAPSDWALHDKVRHRIFGEGHVVGFGDRDIIHIDFGGHRRAIKASMAPLERIP